jgi:transcription initiation factor TFIID TATA-box-binding protein
MKSRVVNVVATAELHQSIDLRQLNKHDWGLYDLDIYPAGYVRDGLILGKVSVFHTGKLISVGAASIKASFNNLEHAKDLLVSAGIIEDEKINPRVRNIVGSVDLEHPVDLPNLVKRIPSIIYEPEQFPGAMIKSRGESISLLIFASGKVVIAGARSLKELKMATVRASRLQEA